jgi:hypothetical protein
MDVPAVVDDDWAQLIGDLVARFRTHQRAT